MTCDGELIAVGVFGAVVLLAWVLSLADLWWSAGRR